VEALYRAFDFLIHPTFWDPNNPPMKVNVNAKTVGLVSAILGALFALFALFAILGLLALGGVATAVGGTGVGGLVMVGVIFIILALITDLMWTYGGWQMYQEKPEGRSMVVVSLALSFIFSVVGDLFSTNIGGIIISLIINGAIYYFVMISRFPNEAPVAGAVMPPPPPPATPPTV